MRQFNCCEVESRSGERVTEMKKKGSEFGIQNLEFRSTTSENDERLNAPF
jgi:hypothetical protein